MDYNTSFLIFSRNKILIVHTLAGNTLFFIWGMMPVLSSIVQDMQFYRIISLLFAQDSISSIKLLNFYLKELLQIFPIFSSFILFSFSFC